LAAERFTSPTGNGTTCSQTSPCDNHTAIRASIPGDIVTMLNGTYRGANHLLDIGAFASGKSGSNGIPITVRAQNDGAVLIDGQGTALPCYLNGNEWWVFEGFNCAESNQSVVLLFESNNNIYRRICAWNAGGSNDHVWNIWNGNDNLFEDICGFGNGRTILTEFSDDATTMRNIYRRFWARWEGWRAGTGGPYLVWQMNYGTLGNYLVENGIGVWGGGRPTGGNPGAVIKVLANSGMAFNGGADGHPAGARLLGTLVYGYSAASIVPSVGWLNAVSGGRITLQDVVVLDSGFNFPHGPVYASCVDAGDCPNAVINRVTTVRGAVASTVGDAWSVTGFQEAPSLSQRDPYNTGTSEASLCYRYIDGVRTGTPLWPWPMDDRIKAALELAGSSPLAGSAAPGYAAGTVTSEVASNLGPIPAACITH